MNTRAWIGSLIRSRAVALLGGAALLLVASSMSAGQGDPPPTNDQPPTGDISHGRARSGDNRAPLDLNDPEVRKRVREMLAKRMENRRRELDKTEQALKMIDEGKSFEEIRSLLPDMPHPGQRGEQGRRWEEDGPGMQGDGADSNRPGGGGTMAGGAGRGQPEPPHPLTAEERESVREILEATAPKLLERIKEREKSQPAEADQQYSETLKRSRYLLDLRKRDPDMYRLKLQEIRHGRQAGEAARDIVEIDAAPNPSASSVAERQKKMDALREGLTKQYGVRTEIMRHDVERLTKELTTRSAQAAETIEKNLKDVIDREKRRRDKPTGDGEHRGPGKPGDVRSADPPKKT